MRRLSFELFIVKTLENPRIRRRKVAGLFNLEAITSFELG